MLVTNRLIRDASPSYPAAARREIWALVHLRELKAAANSAKATASFTTPNSLLEHIATSAIEISRKSRSAREASTALLPVLIPSEVTQLTIGYIRPPSRSACLHDSGSSRNVPAIASATGRSRLGSGRNEATAGRGSLLRETPGAMCGVTRGEPPDEGGQDRRPAPIAATFPRDSSPGGIKQWRRSAWSWVGGRPRASMA